MYLLLEFNRQTLCPHIEKVTAFIVGSDETLEQVINRDFADGDAAFMDNHGIIELKKMQWGNTSDMRFNVIQLHSITH